MMMLVTVATPRKKNQLLSYARPMAPDDLA